MAVADDQHQTKLSLLYGKEHAIQTAKMAPNSGCASLRKVMHLNSATVCETPNIFAPFVQCVQCLYIFVYQNIVY